MAENQTIATTEATAHHEESTFALVTPEIQVVVLTWVTFFIILAVLYKFAWKPILATLDQREQYIKKSLEEADKARAEYEQSAAKCSAMIVQADEKAKEIVHQARHAAQEATRVIEEKAKNEAQILLENATRELKTQTEKAQAQLRQESARLAVELAGKLIEENLNSKKNQELVEKYIQKI